MQRLAKWHKTKIGLLVFAVVELGLSYLLASLAVNSGSLWEWLLAFIFFVGFAQNLVRFLGSFFHGKQH